MKNKIILSEKMKPAKHMLTKLSSILGMSFMLILLALFSTQCKDDDFKGEVTGVCPEVILTSPLNGAINVVTSKAVTANFNEKMDPATINETTFILKKGGNLVSGTVSYNGVTATFIPTNLLTANTVYTATILREATDLMGSIMRKDTTWSFNTGAIPVVVLTDPTQGTSDVVLNKIITADFSTTMNASTINASSFIVKQGAIVIAGTVSYAGLKATFIPTVNLLTNKVYTATITKNAADLAGNTLARDTTWSFATGVLPMITLTDPLNAATNVSVNRKVNVTFSKIMSIATINPSTFTVKQGTNLVSGLISYQDMTATFTPTANLLPGTEYTATVTTGVKDLANNTISKDSTWKFTTSVLIIPVLPYVVSTDPNNLDIDVSFNKVITATFSKAMDATTINSSTFTLMNGTTPVLGHITYTGLVGTFKPAAPLLSGTVYKATVTIGAKDGDGNAMAANKTWSFTTKVLPYITVTDPQDKAVNVPTNKKVTATFSKAMSAASINLTSFTLKQGTTTVSGLVSYQDMTATFTPSVNLLSDVEYTATITTGAKDLANNSIAKDSTWKFTTSVFVAPVLPIVVSTDPNNLDINVALDKLISATFSKAMNATTINSSTFILMNGLIPVTGVVTYVGVKATFNPSAPLMPGTVYTATITNSVKDVDGNAMAANKTWSFTTITPVIVLPIVVSTDPNNLDINVAIDKSVTATFSKTMNATTINSSTFTLMNGLTPVLGVVTYVGVVGIFNPSNPLLSGTVYTATITNSVKDVEGNVMATNKTWSFTTISPVALPYVVSTDPNNLDINVALDKSISATFSKAMNATTINSHTFILMNGLTPVSGVVSYVGMKGTFNPSAPLMPGTVYTATITTGAKDVDGNAIATNKTWSFTSIVPIVQYSVTLTSFPTDGGNTSGGGQFNSGVQVTVNATPKPGFSFTEWTEAGLQVSTLANYSFTISKNRNLMANFAVVNSGPLGIDLGAAGRFAILAGSGISNTGVSTIITGDVGSFPTATINGLLSGNVNGILYTTADPLVGTAKNALTAAYNDAQGRSLNAISLPGQLGGLTLAPGLYVNSSTSGISGTGPQGILTLDAGGNPNSVWIFKMGSTLITGAGTKIVLAGGAQAKNIYWSVGTSATLGTNSFFFGNILADQSITLTTGASLTGRALTRIAAVTLDSNTVTKP